MKEPWDKRVIKFIIAYTLYVFSSISMYIEGTRQSMKIASISNNISANTYTILHDKMLSFLIAIILFNVVLFAILYILDYLSKNLNKKSTAISLMIINIVYLIGFTILFESSNFDILNTLFSTTGLTLVALVGFIYSIYLSVLITKKRFLKKVKK